MLLFRILDRYNRMLAADCLADCFGIRCVILVRLDVRLDELRRDQFDRVPKFVSLRARNEHRRTSSNEAGAAARNTRLPANV